jgi:hypothetical protein
VAFFIQKHKERAVEQRSGPRTEEHEALMAANHHAERVEHLLCRVQSDNSDAGDLADRISQENKQWYRQMKRYLEACRNAIRPKRP